MGFLAAAVFVCSELLIFPLLVWKQLQSRDLLCLVHAPVPTTRYVSGILGMFSQCLNERMAELTSCLKE